MVDFDTSDPRNIWASPEAPDSDGGTGVYDSPFAGVSAALSRAAPGQRVVLLPGVYPGDLTVEVSGEEENPIYIAAYRAGESVIEGGCWYFYDTSDLVVSGLTFANAPHGALSVVGECLRNRFHALEFVDCAASKEASCTAYFGGAGGRDNIIEECAFRRGAEVRAARAAGEPSADNAAVALMVSDGGDNAPLLNYVIRANSISGYDGAVIVGAGGAAEYESGHTVDRNKIENCAMNGIVVNCGDVRVRGNEISGCRGIGIVFAGGEGSEAEGNLISKCGGGIFLSGNGHLAAGNHIMK